MGKTELDGETRVFLNEHVGQVMHKLVGGIVLLLVEVELGSLGEDAVHHSKVRTSSSQVHIAFDSHDIVTRTS